MWYYCLLSFLCSFPLSKRAGCYVGLGAIGFALNMFTGAPALPNGGVRPRRRSWDLYASSTGLPPIRAASVDGFYFCREAKWNRFCAAPYLFCPLIIGTSGHELPYQFCALSKTSPWPFYDFIQELPRGIETGSMQCYILLKLKLHFAIDTYPNTVIGSNHLRLERFLCFGPKKCSM